MTLSLALTPAALVALIAIEVAALIIAERAFGRATGRAGPRWRFWRRARA